jgi:T5SS/PEP-CTERM-associated repeat protein
LIIGSSSAVEVGGVDGLQTASTGTGAINLNGGTLRVAHEDLTSSVNINAINAAGSTISGLLSGTGALNKSGTGTLTLNGAVNLTQSLYLKAGGLSLNGPVNLTQPLYIQGGDLALNAPATVNGFSVGRQDNSITSATVSGTGTTLNAGSFLTVGDNAGSTGTLTVENGGLVQLNPGANPDISSQNKKIAKLLA